ncbi:MAG: CBS and ACT domain-containing protein [Thermoanaerobaculia bacterium]
MRVDHWMTRYPATIELDQPVGKAIQLLKERKVRRLPVLRDGKLVGIVTDRNLKEAQPSQATSLDIWELHFLLEKLKVSDVMSKRLFTIAPDDTIEKAAMIMLEKKVGGLPVVDAAGALVGMLTQGDVFRALVDVTGVKFKKTRVSLLLPDEAGSIRELADACRLHGKIISILVSYNQVPAGMREVIMRIDTSDARALKADLESRFGSVTVAQD